MPESVAHRVPGISDTKLLSEWQGWWGYAENQYFLGNLRISGAARDVGNTGYTTILRGGLVLGKITSGNLLKEWAPAATDGSQWPIAILTRDLDTQEGGANANSLVGRVQYAGYLKQRDIIIPGETAAGISGKDLEFVLRNALARRFLWDDNLDPANVRQYSIAAAATITTAYHNAMIDNIGATGSVTITLPAPKRGLRFLFLTVAEQDIVLSTPATNEFIPKTGTAADNHTITGSNLCGITEVIGVSATQYLVHER